MNWTKAQQSAIEDRGGTLLVSAAAGSGKTRQAPVQAEAEAESQVPAEFMEILDRLVKERMRTLHSGEERYKRLDERIRICQKSRREVAAAMEQERQKNKKLFKKKR